MAKRGILLIILAYAFVYPCMGQGEAYLSLFNVFTTELWSAPDLEKVYREGNGKPVNGEPIYHTLQWKQDTLTVFTQHLDREMVYEFSFRYVPPSSTIAYCDFQRISIMCHPCGEVFLEILLKKYKFREWKENTYISKAFSKTLLHVVRKEGEQDCIVMELKRLSLDDAALGTLYDSLPKYKKRKDLVRYYESKM